MFGGIINRVAGMVAAIVVAVGLAPSASALAGTRVPTCFRHAVAGERPAAIFAAPAGFDCTSRQRGHGTGDFWVLSRPLRAVPPDALIRAGSVWQDGVTLYVRYADGSIRATGFTSADAWRHLKLGAIFELALPRAPVAPVQLLWHVRGAPNVRGLVVNPRIVTVAESQRTEVVMAAFYAAFAGLCLALLFSNAALGAALRQRFHPPYCMMIVTLMGYAATSSGALAQLTGIDNNMRLRANAVLLALTLCSAMLFACRFFAPRMMAGWIRPTVSVAIGVLLCSAGAYAVFMPWRPALLDTAMSLAFLATLGLALPLLWRGWRSDDRYARFFAIAWGAPLLFAMLRAGHALGLVSWSIWIDNSTLVAMTMEASFSALAIAWRIKLLGEERDEARDREALARLLADSDPLTGLMNRRSFLREAIGRTDPQLLVLIDIDHFKQVNDTLGHDGGDQVLRVFAEALVAAAPADALVARMGGEEFAVLAPGGAMDLPDVILTRVRGAPMPYDLAVTASLGSECGTIASEAEWKQLYRRADDALYAAKTAGRDRVRWAVAA